LVSPKGAGAWLPGTIFPAVMAAALIFDASPASAQPAVPRGRAQATSQAGVPNSLETAKLVWSIMVAVDQANRTGNYSVLRGLGGPALQAAQTNDSLARVFADLRARRIDVGNALLVTPTYEIGPLLHPRDCCGYEACFRCGRKV